MNLEHCVVGWDTFKADVSVPACAGKAAHIRELMREAATLFLFLATDNTDLITKLGTFFCKGMDMKPRRLRLEENPVSYCS